MVELLPLMKARKAGLPVILWIVIFLVVVTALVMSSPTISLMLS